VPATNKHASLQEVATTCNKILLKSNFYLWCCYCSMRAGKKKKTNVRWLQLGFVVAWTGEQLPRDGVLGLSLLFRDEVTSKEGRDSWLWRRAKSGKEQKTRRMATKHSSTADKTCRHIASSHLLYGSPPKLGEHL